VSWSAPAANGSPISSYTVTAVDLTTPADGGQSVSGPSGPLEVTGLTDGDTYTFTVTATNASGAGPAGTSAPVIPVGVPGPPVAVSAAPDPESDPGALVVTVVDGPDGGSSIDGYLVTVTDLTDPSDPTNGDVVVGGPGPIDVTGLVSGDTYSFTVEAENAVGTGDPSPPSDPVAAP
jgi:predicted RNA-binding protein with TRAM domain